MHGFIDIYSKLIIAIISFIAPVIVYLLSVFSEGIAIARKISGEQLAQISLLIFKDLDNSGIDSKKLNKSNAALKKVERNSKRMHDLLNPKKQIIKIFSLLFISLFLVMIDVIIKDEAFNLYHRWLSEILIFASIMVFAFGIYSLKRVAWVIIETKQKLYKPTDVSVNIIENVEINNTNVDVKQ